MDQRPGQGLERQVGAWMRFALRQRARRHRRSGGQPRQRQPVVEQRRRPLAHRLQARRAQLVGDPRAKPRDHLGAGLQERLQPPRRPARDVGGVLAVLRRQELDDRPGLAVGAGAEHEGVVLEFHSATDTASLP